MDQTALHEFVSPSSPLYGFSPYDVPAAAPHGSTMVNDQASDPDTTAQANTKERRNVRNVQERSTAYGVDLSENDTQPLQARVPLASIYEEKSPLYRPLMPQQPPDLPGRIPVPGATVERSHGSRAKSDTGRTAAYLASRVRPAARRAAGVRAQAPRDGRFAVSCHVNAVDSSRSPTSPMAFALGVASRPSVEVPHLQHAPGQYNGSARVWRLPPRSRGPPPSARARPVQRERACVASPPSARARPV